MKDDLLKNILEYISYSPDTGELHWRERPQSMFKTSRSRSIWTTRFCGRVALTGIGANGYKRGTVFGVSVLAHRVAWALAYGNWPNGEIDHINGDRTDNRLSNLRDVGRSENGKNISRGAKNTSGCIGVSYNKLQRKWVAYIQTDGVFQSLGTHKSFEAAAAARKVAEILCGFHKNHGRPKQPPIS